MVKQLIGLLLFITFSSYAEKTVEVPLTYATEQRQDLVLRGQSQTVSIPISILAGQEVKAIKLSLAIYNNNRIDKSLLWVAAGNRTLANVEIKQKDKFQYVEMTIPPELLARKEPKLNLRIQHLSDDVELVVDTTKLSTTISAEESSYALTYVESEGFETQTLFSFEEMIRSGQHHSDPVHLVSGIHDNTDLALGIAASLVQGWTLKSRSEDYAFDYQATLLPPPHLNGPTVVFGTKDHLLNAGWINQEMFNEITGPYLAVSKHKKNLEWLLILSGNNNREVKRASKVFGYNLRRLPDQSSMVVKKDDMVTDQTLKSSSSYAINSFTPQQDLTDSPLEISFLMPSNIMFSSEDNAKLNLLLTHSQVAPGAGSMILRVNGEYANSLPLRSSYWRETQHYRLNIPMRHFHPGVNKVSVEIYGPVDIKNQQRRFSVYMSDKSNLRLGSWVSFIPTEDHHVSASDLLTMTNSCGMNAQITVDPTDPVQLKNLWRLLSHVSHRTHKATPGLLVTSDKTQQREFQVSLSKIERIHHLEEDDTETSKFHALRQALFDFVVSEDTSQDSQTEPFSVMTNELAYIEHGKQQGWYRIQFYPASNEAFDDFLRSKTVIPPAGVLSEKEFSSGSNQFVRAAFIGYPAALSAVALLIIWWMSAFVTRFLEGRK
ncbi:cellulose biosynthesis cyclic di-GMP-binding regulatory protein BcsB [Grimontia kaedaensis]|uniref:Cellulose biosynthesis cyclic di-GMP-binding regulatory protein BcsB n=1 Tax=Grimontia kaedaensis TaxID=2872157 RepID=A0ABY4X146_9GAMM|nr:cellulose biosynthesis cyclic di-GMP-binding regulatory protein BcsB [Grimontia kaedaensis]USH04933.1 cellulose biosynthesis cyclic di-GMP-binding regulatory protein BcsB [Grimontia kaedaensis]